MEGFNGIRVFGQAPHPFLRPYVRRLMIVEFPVACRDFHLPMPGLVAAFRYQGDCGLSGIAAPRAAITGLYGALRSHDHGENSANVIVQFTALGASAFVQESLDVFANATGDLERVLAPSTGVAEVSERLSESFDHAARFELVERLLAARVYGQSLDPAVSAAVEWIETKPVSVRIKTLAEHIGLSQSALERRFKRVVGASPKAYASLVRLQRVARLRAAGLDLSSIAHEAGYFDQAHFARDFRRFAGQAPQTYFGRSAPR